MVKSNLCSISSLFQFMFSYSYWNPMWQVSSHFLSFVVIFFMPLLFTLLLTTLIPSHLLLSWLSVILAVSTHKSPQKFISLVIHRLFFFEEKFAFAVPLPCHNSYPVPVVISSGSFSSLSSRATQFISLFSSVIHQLFENLLVTTYVPYLLFHMAIFPLSSCVPPISSYLWLSVLCCNMSPHAYNVFSIPSPHSSPTYALYRLPCGWFTVVSTSILSELWMRRCLYLC